MECSLLSSNVAGGVHLLCCAAAAAAAAAFVQALPCGHLELLHLQLLAQLSLGPF